MRYLVWLLLLANLGMFVWVLTQPEPQPAQYRPVPVPPGVEPLVLLSERPGNTLAAVNSEAEQEAAGNVRSAEPPVADTAPADDTVPTTPAPSQSASADEPGNAAGDERPEPVAPPEPVCETVGPFPGQADAEGVSGQLSRLGYQPSLRTGEVRNPAGYWVYLPAMPARDARRIVSELDARGVTDYYIGKQNYVSLGIFSGKRKAQSRLDQIRGMGYDAVLDQRFRTSTVYWVDIVQGDEPLLASSAWPDILSHHPDIRVQRISCE